MLGSLNWCLGTSCSESSSVPVIAFDSHTDPAFRGCVCAVNRLASRILRRSASTARILSILDWIFDLRCDPVSVNKLSIESFERIHLRLPNPLGSSPCTPVDLPSPRSSSGRSSASSGQFSMTVARSSALLLQLYLLSVVNKPFPIAHCDPSGSPGLSTRRSSSIDRSVRLISRQPNPNKLDRRRVPDNLY